MGLLNKCVLRFDRVFWPPEVDWIDFLGPTETLWADWTSYLRATGRPLLAGFNAARMADEVEAWDDRDTTASAMEALRAMFGTAVPDPLGSQISRWRQDPFAMGAYSYKAVGTRTKDRKALFGTDWDGRLSFAGEADVARLSGHGPWGTDDRTEPPQRSCQGNSTRNGKTASRPSCDDQSGPTMSRNVKSGASDSGRVVTASATHGRRR